MSRVKICVILGAGASLDVAGPGSPIINPSLRPPLAIDLFDIQKHDAYWSIMERYNGAVVLGQQLAAHIPSGAFNLEKELRRYAEHKDDNIRKHFKYIPAYLRDLIFWLSKEYTPAPSSYIQLVQELLAESPHDVLFIVLNYDNLLEVALERFDKKFRFREINQYIEESRNAKVVKMHGSINWFRCLRASGNARWDNAIENFDLSEPMPEHEILIQDGVRDVSKYALKDHRIYPILTAPLAGKGLTDAVCPKGQLEVAQKFISNCAKFLIIGTSGLDEDLLELLNKAIDPMHVVKVHFVNQGEGANNAYDRFRKGVRAFHERGFQKIPFVTLYNNGFADYLISAEFRSFLSQPV